MSSEVLHEGGSKEIGGWGLDDLELGQESSICVTVVRDVVPEEKHRRLRRGGGGRHGDGHDQSEGPTAE